MPVQNALAPEYTEAQVIDRLHRELRDAQGALVIAEGARRADFIRATEMREALKQIATLQRCGNSFDEAEEMQRIARSCVSPEKPST